MKHLRRILAGCLLVCLLIPTALAGSCYDPDPYYWQRPHPLTNFQYSPWAEKELETVLGWETIPVEESDLRAPISRGAFAELAAAFAAMEFGSNLDSYLLITSYRGQAEGLNVSPTRLATALDLGILQGRGGDDLGLADNITRQEAAVMLARTYRLYHDAQTEPLTPLSFQDQEKIASWAEADVQRMAALGILNGKENGRFDPLGLYTKEQCLATLARLHTQVPYDGSKADNPFAIQKNLGFVKVWDPSNESYAFAMETEDYFICARVEDRSASGEIGNDSYCIQIVDRDAALRSYPVPILKSASNRGEVRARPENPVLSADGRTLTYTAALDQDAYRTHWKEDGTWAEELLFQKGVYTVTMDLETGKQTYTRA